MSSLPTANLPLSTPQAREGHSATLAHGSLSLPLLLRSTLWEIALAASKCSGQLETGSLSLSVHPLLLLSSVVYCLFLFLITSVKFLCHYIAAQVVFWNINPLILIAFALQLLSLRSKNFEDFWRIMRYFNGCRFSSVIRGVSYICMYIMSGLWIIDFICISLKFINLVDLSITFTTCEFSNRNFNSSLNCDYKKYLIVIFKLANFLLAVCILDVLMFFVVPGVWKVTEPTFHTPGTTKNKNCFLRNTLCISIDFDWSTVQHLLDQVYFDSPLFNKSNKKIGAGLIICYSLYLFRHQGILALKFMRPNLCVGKMDLVVMYCLSTHTNTIKDIWV